MQLHPTEALAVAKRHRAEEILAADRHRQARTARAATTQESRRRRPLAGRLVLAAGSTLVGLVLVLSVTGSPNQLPPQDTPSISNPA